MWNKRRWMLSIGVLSPTTPRKKKTHSRVTVYRNVSLWVSLGLHSVLFLFSFLPGVTVRKLYPIYFCLFFF